jgi:hypothetical protein
MKENEKVKASQFISALITRLLSRSGKENKSDGVGSAVHCSVSSSRLTSLLLFTMLGYSG